MSYWDNGFVQLCTEATAPGCVTWTYPDLGATDFQCTSTNTFIWVSTWATGLAAVGSGSASSSSTELLKIIPVSTVGDAFINKHQTGAGKQPLSSTAAASPTSTLAAANNSTNSTGGSSAPGGSSVTGGSSVSDSSSVSGGAIAGAVVGSVVGVAGIGAALFMFFLMRRKKHQAAAAAAAVSSDESRRAMTQENEVAPAYTPFSQGGSGKMLSPSEIDGRHTTWHRSDLSEVDGSSNSPPVTEVEGNNMRPIIPQEMDARAEVSELPNEYSR